MSTNREPLIPLRSAVVLLLALVVGLVTGALTYAGGRDALQAVLATLASFGGATLFFHQIIGR